MIDIDLFFHNLEKGKVHFIIFFILHYSLFYIICLYLGFGVPIRARAKGFAK